MPEMAVKGGKADWMANKEEGRRRIAAGEMVIPEDQRDPEDFSVYPSAANLNTAFSDSTAGQLADRTLGALNAPVAVAKGLGHMVSEAPGHIRGFMSGEYNTDTPEGARRAAAAAFDLGGAAAGIGAVPLTAEAAARGARAVGLLSDSTRQSVPVAAGKVSAHDWYTTMGTEADKANMAPKADKQPAFTATQNYNDSQRPQIPPKVDSTGLYSHLDHVLNNERMFSGTADQWRKQLKRYGVKDSEMYWRGLDDFLKENAGKEIHKGEIKSHLNANQVRVGRRTHTEEGYPIEEIVNDEKDARVQDALDNGDYEVRQMDLDEDTVTAMAHDDFRVEPDPDEPGMYQLIDQNDDVIDTFNSEGDAWDVAYQDTRDRYQDGQPYAAYERGSDQPFWTGEHDQSWDRAADQAQQAYADRVYGDYDSFDTSNIDLSNYDLKERTKDYMGNKPVQPIDGNFTEDVSVVNEDTFRRRGSKPWEKDLEDVHPGYAYEGGLGWTLRENYQNAVPAFDPATGAARPMEGTLIHELQSIPGQTGARQPKEVVDALRRAADQARDKFKQVETAYQTDGRSSLADQLREIEGKNPELGQAYRSTYERLNINPELVSPAHKINIEGISKEALEDAIVEMPSARSGNAIKLNNTTLSEAVRNELNSSRELLRIHGQKAWSAESNLETLLEDTRMRTEDIQDMQKAIETGDTSVIRDDKIKAAFDRAVDRAEKDRQHLANLSHHTTDAEFIEARNQTWNYLLDSKKGLIEDSLETIQRRKDELELLNAQAQRAYANIKKFEELGVAEPASKNQAAFDAWDREKETARLRRDETEGAWKKAYQGVDPGPFIDDNKSFPVLMKQALYDAAKSGDDFLSITGPKRMRSRWPDEGVETFYEQNLPNLMQKLAQMHDPKAKLENFYPGETHRPTAEWSPVDRMDPQRELDLDVVGPYIINERTDAARTFDRPFSATHRPREVVLDRDEKGNARYLVSDKDGFYLNRKGEWTGSAKQAEAFMTRDAAENAISGLNKAFDEIDADPRSVRDAATKEWKQKQLESSHSGYGRRSEASKVEPTRGIRLTKELRDSILKYGFPMFANQSRAALPGAFANLVDLGPSAFQALETAPSKLSRHMETPEGVAFADAQPYSVKEDHFNRSPLIESPFQEGRTQPGYGVYATEEGGLESNPMGSRFFNHPSVKDLEGQAAFDSMMLAQNEIGGIYDRPNVPGTDPLGVEDVRVGLGRRANFDEVSGLAQNLPGGAFGLIDQSGRGTGLRFIGEPGQMDTAAIMARMKELGMDPMRPESSVGSSVMPSFKNEWAQPEGSGAVTAKAFDYIDQMSPEMRARLDTPKQRMRVSQQNEMEQQIMSQLGLRGRQDLIHLRDIYFRQGLEGLKAALARGGELPSNEAIAALIPALMQDAEMSDHGA